ncbi:hypothetical protein [Paenibacillus sinopodophylli]|uniref:hypothetical protein n=1 Tax=Paenibacillus sinopodophylli TaxID=1837342 RepID=UPI00110CC90C|nr:hypothetical protein [Paenibacillus sinopodophylli]
MSTTKLKKLTMAIESARVFISNVVIGDQPTNYPQEAVDIFLTAVEEAEKVASIEGSEGQDLDAAIVLLQRAEEILRAAENPVPDDEVLTKVVQLIGTDSERKGAHSIHFGKVIINFKDGQAELSKELADELIDAGYAE